MPFRISTARFSVIKRKLILRANPCVGGYLGTVIFLHAENLVDAWNL
jgi:hypothetical protein